MRRNDYGPLSLAALIVIDGTIADMPASLDAAAWYFPAFTTMNLATPGPVGAGVSAVITRLCSTD